MTFSSSAAPSNASTSARYGNGGAAVFSVPVPPSERVDAHGTDEHHGSLIGAAVSVSSGGGLVAAFSPPGDVLDLARDTSRGVRLGSVSSSA